MLFWTITFLFSSIIKVIHMTCALCSKPFKNVQYLWARTNRNLKFHSLKIFWLKRIVHPKNTYSVIIYSHPKVAPNLHEFLCSVEQKRWYVEEYQQPNSCRPPSTPTVWKKKYTYHGGQWGPPPVWPPTLPNKKNIYIVFNRTKKFIHE